MRREYQSPYQVSYDIGSVSLEGLVELVLVIVAIIIRRWVPLTRPVILHTHRVGLAAS